MKLTLIITLMSRGGALRLRGPRRTSLYEPAIDGDRESSTACDPKCRGLLQRCHVAIGACLMQQYFSYLPSKVENVDEKKGWSWGRVDALVTDLNERFWSVTKRPGQSLKFAAIFKIFKEQEVREWVNYYAPGDKTEDGEERKTQDRVMDDLAQRSTQWELAHIDTQDRRMDGVISLLVNHRTKAAVLAFRGSQNRLDWYHNLVGFRNAFTLNGAAVEDPKHRRAKIHAGYNRVLFKQSNIGRNGNSQTLHDRIKDVLKAELVDQGRGSYTLTVTGHSLGGALATLEGFALAEDKDVQEWFQVGPGRPVEVLSFANPPVGNFPFKHAHTAVEKAGRLRSVSIRSRDDPVGWVNVAGATWLRHVGSRIVLHGGGLFNGQIEYPKTKSKGAWNPLSYFTRGIAVPNHFTWTYEDRIKLAIEAAEPKRVTLADAYAEFFKPGEAPGGEVLKQVPLVEA